MLAAIAFAASSPAAAAAEQPRANPVYWEPADATAGEQIDVILTLTGAGDPDDVAVVIRGSRGERTFPAIPLGSGRYRTTITFPFGGGWDVRTSYRSRADGHRGEVPLGKSGIMIPGLPPTRERAAPATRPAVIAGALALVLGLSGLAAAVSRSASRGNPALPG
jgi:hypothetical protein